MEVDQQVRPTTEPQRRREYAANQVVLYNRRSWAEAGIRTLPGPYPEFFPDSSIRDDARKASGPGHIALLTQETYQQRRPVKDGDRWVSQPRRPQGQAKTIRHLQAGTVYRWQAPKDRTEATRGRVFALRAGQLNPIPA